VEADLATLSKHPKFRGVRHVVQDEPDDRFMLGAEFLRGLGKLHTHGLTYDLLVFPRQLPAAIDVVRRFPEQPFVLDHIAKPEIKSGKMSPWQEQIRELAKLPNVMCKVSGMVTEADHSEWKSADFIPYLEVVLSAFGVDRLMYGSDWPVCLLAGSYERVFDLANVITITMGGQGKDKFFGGNAARFYGITT
jgi:L-fuconolactonase